MFTVCSVAFSFGFIYIFYSANCKLLSVETVYPKYIKLDRKKSMFCGFLRQQLNLITVFVSSIFLTRIFSATFSSSSGQFDHRSE